MRQQLDAWRNRELTGVRPEAGENEWSPLGKQHVNKTDEHNYPFVEIEGKGHFVGINYYVDSAGFAAMSKKHPEWGDFAPTGFSMW